MDFARSQSAASREALALVTDLQQRFVAGLQAAQQSLDPPSFQSIAWLRDGGIHGGGERWATGQTAVFNRASVNVSHVHYDDRPDKRLACATALSTIVHPHHPQLPSIHCHLSWTELKDGSGGWRWMADLNPSIPRAADTERFVAALAEAAGPHLDAGRKQGDRYFWIPALDRHRGVAHFYLEGHRTADAEADLRNARHFGQTVLDHYAALLGERLGQLATPTEAEREAQRAYHTLYLFQVLTLDRGTTSGLLVHANNDVGVLGSLPSHVDRGLLHSWRPRLPELQRPLLDALVEALPESDPAPVTDPVKRRLAQACRAHYQQHPEALALQARGDVLPPTVANHGGAGSQ